MGVGCALARVLREEHDGKVARLVRVPSILQMFTPKRFSIILSTLLPVLSVPLPRVAATASLAADGVEVRRIFWQAVGRA